MLVGCLVLQAALANLLPSPWWVPDLASIGLVLVIPAAPRRWPVYAGVASVAMLVGTVRWVPLLVAASFLTAWCVRVAAQRWDAADPRVQVAFVLGASGLTLLAALWSESLLGVAAVWGWGGLRLALTMLTACGVSWALRRTT